MVSWSNMQASGSRHVVLTLVLASMVSVGCKKKPPEPIEPPPVVEVVRLGVVSITPSVVAPDTSVDARLRGSNFINGATVTIGSQAATNVVVTDSNAISLTVPALTKGTYDVTVTNMDGTTGTLRGGLVVKSSIEGCKHVSVKFPFDSSSIPGSGRSSLDSRLDCYQGAGSLRVEGHADERGTVDYNLALGQRRADATKSHLTGAGISSSKVTTISYGEERPEVQGSSESAWAANRRADVNASE